MKWNRKNLLAALPKIAKQAGIRDFTGESADDVVAFFKAASKGDDGVVVDGLETEAEQRAAFKMVTIEVDGDNVSVNGEPVTSSKSDDELEDEEKKAQEEQAKEDAENEEKTKAYKLMRKHFGNQVPEHFGKVAGAANGGTKRIGDKRSVVMKSYERCYKNNTPMRGSKNVPIFESAEQAETVGAMLRMATLPDVGYAQKAADTKIITKSGSTFDPSAGAALVIHEYAPELIELFDQYGVARRAVGITKMKTGEKTVARLDSDIQVYDIGEGNSFTESDESTSPVKLTATKTGALKRLPSELLEDMAISVVDIFGRSTARGVGKWEDESYIKGMHNRTGLDSLIVNTGTDRFDSNSGGWSGITITDIQTAIGLLPAWAHAEGIEIMCSTAYYSTVLESFAASAGGNTGADLKAGFGGMDRWGKFPVHLTEVMPSSYVDGQNVMYIGAFGAASKFGLVDGSEEIATSNERYFDTDEFAVRYKQRWAINLHDIGGANSGVVALQA